MPGSPVTHFLPMVFLGSFLGFFFSSSEDFFILFFMCMCFVCKLCMCTVCPGSEGRSEEGMRIFIAGGGSQGQGWLGFDDLGTGRRFDLWDPQHLMFQGPRTAALCAPCGPPSGSSASRHGDGSRAGKAGKSTTSLSREWAWLPPVG